MAILISHSPEETEEIGAQLGQKMTEGAVVCFYGDLAAGKTTFIKGFVKGACGIDPIQVNSPTFVYLNIYKGLKTVYHFDLYRLTGRNDFMGMGFDEYLGGEGIACIEWSERLEGFTPDNLIEIKLSHMEENKRRIEINEY